jgi:hypothetical protein
VARLFGSTPRDVNTAIFNADPLLEFPAEARARVESTSRAGILRTPDDRVFARLSPAAMAAIVAAIIVIVGLGLMGVRRLSGLQVTAQEPSTGTLTIDTRPTNLEISIDGEPGGATPVTVSLPAGPHTITVRNGRDQREVPLAMAPGADLRHYIEMQPTEPASATGRVSVMTDPPGAQVFIDGRRVGVSPVLASDLTPGEHDVSVTSDAGSIQRTVAVGTGGTASVLFSLPKTPGPVGGWLTVTAPFDVAVAEGEDVIGTSGASRIMLAAGRHDITLTNRSLGYEAAHTVNVVGGKTTAVRVDPPKVLMSVNARPWAEITLDGSSLGQTPIANLPVTIGPHEMVFRHPQFPEQRQTVVVTVNGPNRVAADLTK